MDTATALEERLKFAGRLIASLTAAALPTQASALTRDFNLRTKGPHVSVHAVRKWLKGEAFPTQDKVVFLAKWLNVDAPWLRFGTAEARAAAPKPLEKGEFSSEHLTLLRDIACLSKASQTVVRDLVNSLTRVAALWARG